MQWLKVISSMLSEARAAITARRRTQASLALAPHLALGQRGEGLARAHLKRMGYRIVASNFRLPIGRNLRGVLVFAEIDIVAYEAATLCFVEVKTRRSDVFAAPEANVDLRKQRQISRASTVYRRMFNLERAPYRYDVASVVLPEAEEGSVPPPPRVELLRNFWTDEKFSRKRRRFYAVGDY